MVPGRALKCTVKENECLAHVYFSQVIRTVRVITQVRVSDKSLSDIFCLKDLPLNNCVALGANNFFFLKLSVILFIVLLTKI